MNAAREDYMFTVHRSLLTMRYPLTVSRLPFTTIYALSVNHYPWFRDKGKGKVKGQGPRVNASEGGLG